jgi:hypothetical protein
MSKYETVITGNPKFVGTFVFLAWIFGFPWYLYMREGIMTGKVKLAGESQAD